MMESILSQDLDKGRFEIIFVENGEKDGSGAIIKEFISNNRKIKTKYFYSEIKSLSNARNIGIGLANFSHITFVDCDDTISDSYLKSMYERLDAKYISCSNIVNVYEDGKENIIIL
ncbi:glycosyltransferase family 2 protein [Ochrobactrum daejeonense]|nr:glycosyltransferase family 2 protein [Brucella daejeonensis]